MTTVTTAPKLLLTGVEAAERLGISRTKVYELMAAGTLSIHSHWPFAAGARGRTSRLHRGTGVGMSGRGRRGRRGRGEGSVFQRSNGIWVAQIDLAGSAVDVVVAPYTAAASARFWPSVTSYAAS